MLRTGSALLISAFALAGCGGSGGSSGPNEALFAGPLMFVGAQMRIYGSTNLQLADFNGDSLPELFYEGRISPENDYRSLVILPGSETEIFGAQTSPADGENSSLADFDNDGNLDIVSFIIYDTETRRGLPPYDWSILLGNGDNTFADPEPLGLVGITDTSVGVASADINGDGFQDLLSLGYATGDIQPLVNQGDGTFDPVQPVQAPTTFGTLAGADLNNDTFDDIVFFHVDGTDIALSLGDGTFGELQPTGLFSGPPLTDLDLDGNLDMVRGATNGEIWAYLGEGDGTFAPALVSTLSQDWISDTPLAVADFNDDTVPDLVLVMGEPISPGLGPFICLILGRGDGTFGPDIIVIDEGASNTAVTMDADGDGNLDLLVVGGDDVAFLRPYFGNGDGTFREETSTFIDVDSSARMITEIIRLGKRTTQPLDVDADGNLDLLVRNSTASGDVSLFLGDGDGTFAAEQRRPLGNVRIQQTADLDDDGLVDFFGQTMTRFFGILRNYGGGDLQPLPLIPVTLTSTPDPGFEGAYDLDEDGLLDPLFWFEGGDIRVLYNLGDMQFEPLTTVTNIGEEALRAIVDITGDGYPDIVSDLDWNEPISRFFVRPGRPSRTFGPPMMSEILRPTGDSAVIAFGSAPYETADFNGDGRADIVLVRDQIADEGERTVVSLLYGQADGRLVQAEDSYVPWVGLLTQIADLDLDNGPELVVGSVTLSDLVDLGDRDRLSVHALLTNNAGQFELAPGIPTVIGSLFEDFDFSVSDITGDGFPDALVYSENIGLVIALGQGDGTFGRPFYFRTGGGTEPAVGDFDNDGDGDFAAITAAGGQIEIVYNRLVQE